MLLTRMMMDWIFFIVGKQLHRMFPRRVTTWTGDFLCILHGMPPVFVSFARWFGLRNRISDVLAPTTMIVSNMHVECCECRSVGLSNGWVSLSSIYSVLIKNCITPTVITIYGDCRDICAPGGRDADRMNDDDDDYCSLWRMKWNSMEWNWETGFMHPFPLVKWLANR